MLLGCCCASPLFQVSEYIFCGFSGAFVLLHGRKTRLCSSPTTHPTPPLHNQTAFRPSSRLHLRGMTQLLPALAVLQQERQTVTRETRLLLDQILHITSRECSKQNMGLFGIFGEGLEVLVVISWICKCFVEFLAG